MKTNYTILNYLVGLILLLPFGQASALLIDSYSGTDKGVDYSLEVAEISGAYTLTYALNTSGFSSGSSYMEALHAVSVKAFSSISDPGTFLTSGWTAVEGQISANTTATNKQGQTPMPNVVGPGSGWLSAYSLSDTGLGVPDGIITFTWEGIMGTLLDDPSAKAVYVFAEKAQGNKVEGDFATQTSIGLNGGDHKVPEPTPLVLLAMGLAVIGLGGRKLVVLRKV